MHAAPGGWQRRVRGRRRRHGSCLAGPMRITYQSLAMGCASLLVLGCVEKADPTDTTSESAETTVEPTTAGTQINEPSAPGTDTEPPSSDTDTTSEPGPPSSDTDTTSEPGATEPADSESATEPASTESETDTDTGMAFPEECVEPDPDVTATFSVSIDWPEASDDFHYLDVTCTIDAMTEDAGSFEHALTCDDAGTPRPMIMRAELPTGGAVTWAAGDSVRLKSNRLIDDDFGIDTHSVWMWAADETPLLMARRGGDDPDPNIEPIAYTAEFPCGEEDNDGGMQG